MLRVQAPEHRWTRTSCEAKTLSAQAVLSCALPWAALKGSVGPASPSSPLGLTSQTGPKASPDRLLQYRRGRFRTDGVHSAKPPDRGRGETVPGHTGWRVSRRTDVRDAR